MVGTTFLERAGCSTICSAGLARAGVKLCFCVTAISWAWSDAPRRSQGISKISWLFPFQAPQGPFRAVFVKNQQDHTELCCPKSSIRAHSSREQRKRKPAATSLHGALESAQTAQHVVRRRKPDQTRDCSSVLHAAGFTHFSEHLGGKNPMLRIRAVLCSSQPKHIWLF